MDCKYGFKEAKKGYDCHEVDEYIDQQLATMEAMQKQNAVLMRRLQEAQVKIRQYEETEKSLRRSIAESKRGAHDMLASAKTQSVTLVDTAREECNRIVDELDAEVENRYRAIENMRSAVSAFKNELFKLYSDHIENIEAIADAAENFTYEPDYTALSDAIDEFEVNAEQFAEPEEVPEFPEVPEESFFTPEDVEQDAEDEEIVEAPRLSEEEFGFAEPEAEQEHEETPENEAAKTETDESDDMFFDPDEVRPVAEEDDMFFRDGSNENKDKDEDGDEEKIDEDVLQFSFGEQTESAEEEEIFQFPEETEDQEEEIFQFPENTEEDGDDDMFITDSDERKEKEELFNFLKDFVNGTEE